MREAPRERSHSSGVEASTAMGKSGCRRPLRGILSLHTAQRGCESRFTTDEQRSSDSIAPQPETSRIRDISPAFDFYRALLNAGKPIQTFDEKMQGGGIKAGVLEL